MYYYASFQFISATLIEKIYNTETTANINATLIEENKEAIERVDARAAGNEADIFFIHMEIDPLKAKVDEAEALAKGAQQAVAFNTYADMQEAFLAEDVTSDAGKYFVGQSVYIGTINVPDLWISHRNPHYSANTYESDEAIVNALKDRGYITIGHYELRQLETGKVNLEGIPENIEDGSGSGAIQQVADGVADGLDFTARNPNAIELDNSLAGVLPYGATGDFSASFGGKSIAIGKRSMAVGNKTVAKGEESLAAGYQCVTLGSGSFAIGTNTTALGEVSSSFGHSTIAKGEASFAEGFNTIAEGTASHAGGGSTVAKGQYSYAGGYNTLAGYDNQTVIGHFNDNNQENIFEIGNGDDSLGEEGRSNAFEVRRDGSAAYVGGKKLLTEDDSGSGGGTKLYEHYIAVEMTPEWLVDVYIVSTRSTKYTSKYELIDDAEDSKILCGSIPALATTNVFVDGRNGAFVYIHGTVIASFNLIPDTIKDYTPKAL